MNIVFDLKSFTTKLYLSGFIVTIFYLLYLTIPDSEFNNVSTTNCKIDRIYYTIATHTGRRDSDSLKPVSLRAKILSILHMILAFSVVIL